MESHAISSKEIDVSRLEQRLEREVVRAGIKDSVKIIQAEPRELKKLANLTDEDIDVLKQLAAETILPRRFIRASEALEVYGYKWRTIALDCPPIDAILRGGIPTRGINELYGVSGAGKTQFCLQLAITVQYPLEFGGSSAGCVYICTEAQFPNRRLQQLVPHFPRDERFSSSLLAKVTDNILVDHIPDVESLNECLTQRLPVLLSNRKIGLIVIDSIAALFRADYTKDQMITRSKHMRTIGMQLHQLADKYKLAVLCVNQVSDSIETNQTVPALGLVWANLVTTKLKVDTRPDGSKVFSVITCPHLPPNSCPYKITARGIESLSS
ncbi:X-ray repair complementing defective repair in Chinese hamster cells 3 [Nesidiocoris tenuis]|uniref:X-ray repair complementing defective repair in Chinese hamster cells 3 n=1 Tax=Nesidiocoris tenuis TaxID=355587 RepID=A0ABN7AT39_9HEMI|nr:X-ray repair complementing defective repair in Chinese hamster cells 3 [Nesidiocoris tenuis]